MALRNTPSTPNIKKNFKKCQLFFNATAASYAKMPRSVSCAAPAARQHFHWVPWRWGVQQESGGEYPVARVLQGVAGGAWGCGTEGRGR